MTTVKLPNQGFKLIFKLHTIVNNSNFGLWLKLWQLSSIYLGQYYARYEIQITSENKIL